MVVAGHEQRVAGEERAVVEERDRALVFEDQVRRLVAGDDLTEAAVRVLAGHGPRYCQSAGGRRGELTPARTPRRSRRTLQHRWSCCARAARRSSDPAVGRRRDGDQDGASTAARPTQEAVATAFRQIQFTVKKGKVTLTTEPIVARGLCLSTAGLHARMAPSSKKLGAEPHLHADPHLLRQQDRQDPRPVRELERGRGLRDLPLLRAGPLLSRARRRSTSRAKHK